MERLFKPTLIACLVGLSSLSMLPITASAGPIISTTPIHVDTLPQQGTLPQWRSSGHFSLVGNNAYLWGGYVQCFTPGCTQGFPTEMQTFNTQTNNWAVVSTAGPTPEGRTYQGQSTWQDGTGTVHIMVYGGLQFQPDFSVFKSYGDFWDFNTSNNTWTQISALATPGKRFGANFQVVAQKGYLFAGVEDLGGFNFIEHNDLWSYDFSSHVWTQLIPDDPAENPQNQPGSRYRANFDYGPSIDGIVLFGGDRLVLPGQPDKPHRHDTWVLKLHPTVHWEFKSDQVDPVVDPVSGVLGTQHVVGFGDFEPQDQSQRCCSAPAGDPTRFCDDAVKNIFSNPHVNAAGTDYTKYVNVSGTTPLKRAAYVKYGAKLLIWGGYNLDCSKGLDKGELQFNTNTLSLNLTELIKNSKNATNLSKKKIKSEK